jgi:hypothetical protein
MSFNLQNEDCLPFFNSKSRRALFVSGVFSHLTEGMNRWFQGAPPFLAFSLSELLTLLETPIILSY